MATGEGETFGQCLTTLRAADWRTLLEFRGNDLGAGMEEWLERMVEEVGLDRNLTWYYDQWITTFKLLQHRICTAPAYSGLWNKAGLHFDPDLDDSDTWVVNSDKRRKNQKKKKFRLIQSEGVNCPQIHQAKD